MIAWHASFRGDPRDHLGITPAKPEILPAPRVPGTRDAVPWGRLTRRMLPVTPTYVCCGWTRLLFLNGLPSFFKEGYGLDLKKSALLGSGMFFAGVVGDTLGLILPGFLGAAASLVWVLLTRGLTAIVVLLSAGFFILELVIGPIRSVPVGIAPRGSGTASGLMNIGSALAAIVSLLAFGWIADQTGDGVLSFAGSIGLLVAGAGLAFTLHPERRFLEDVAGGRPGTAAPAATE